MKIVLRRNRKKKTFSVTFRAETDVDGVNLRDAVLDAGLDPSRIIDTLGATGYTADASTQSANRSSVTCSPKAGSPL